MAIGRAVLGHGCEKGVPCQTPAVTVLGFSGPSLETCERAGCSGRREGPFFLYGTCSFFPLGRWR